MGGRIDVNTVASAVTVIIACWAALRFHAKASAWFTGVDQKFEDQKVINEATAEQLKGIQAELKPNHGSSHHDVLVKEIHKAAEEAVRKIARDAQQQSHHWGRW